MKKNIKKDNKGFSLVELIVVVLIMAIIAVALAPQVMKWVENSRQAKDMQTVDTLVSACQLAVTKSGNATASQTFAIDTNGEISLSGSGFIADVNENLGNPGKLTFTSTKFKPSSGTLTVVTVTSGVVKKSLPTGLSSDLN